MTLIILALLFGIALMVFLVRDFAADGGFGIYGLDRYDKTCKLLKILLSVETAAYIVIFVIVLIKTIFA